MSNQVNEGRWGVVWCCDWKQGMPFDLRILEISIASDDGIAFGVVVMGFGFAIYRSSADAEVW